MKINWHKIRCVIATICMVLVVLSSCGVIVYGLDTNRRTKSETCAERGGVMHDGTCFNRDAFVSTSNE